MKHENQLTLEHFDGLIPVLLVSQRVVCGFECVALKLGLDQDYDADANYHQEGHEELPDEVFLGAIPFR